MSGGDRHVRVVLRVHPPTGDALPDVVVAVDDVTRADAPARRVAATRLRDVVVPGEGIVVQVTVPAGAGAAVRGRRYTVRARAGADADAGTFAPADLLSTGVPVTLDGTDDVTLELRPLT
ncbi:hypothetical protein [Cellulomonas fimi]|uniref:Uncharacterized protein n=1 Tax=Cellulomonas fimi (strain ATCC 484 / DSM 20113 / JCM 1341 / CCUG 24087 / LMG 16345 / NBRC 15513 / NCIMB 8980 / NCTC 7547 / NRS-133) TaxID=590998 RepID=F4H066_CELFA|nr:hypothetical protein [Cellulomonas fimi]AEE46113.1 hypothetical protein Celf_1983 [Cellulomonas fimi ATCC 484]NNH08440.1 hypothetical protein [Cellulomonas fimi]VEH31683.1 Uncharacterised protein [Cellulomonas fimi]